MIQEAIIRYTGDRPFFIAMNRKDRFVFNRHNNFTKRLVIEECESVVRQWGKFFVVEPIEQVVVPIPEDPVKKAKASLSRKQKVAKRLKLFATGPSERRVKALPKKKKPLTNAERSRAHRERVKNKKVET